MRRFILSLLLSSSVAFAAAPKPTPASLRKAFEANAGHVVKVKGPRKSGPGVVVSADGHVVTSTEYVSLDAAKVVSADGELSAGVVFADAALKVAVLKTEATMSASPVDLDKTIATGDWLLAIGHTKDGAADPKVGQVLRTDRAPFIETDLFFPAGTPLYDPKGKLVAVLVTSKGRALPMQVVKAKLDGSRPVTAQELAP